jgi:chromosome segregation ATPase
MDNETRLKKIEKDINEINTQRASAEAQLNMLRQQRDEVLEELNKLGIDPKQLSITIQNLENEIDSQLKEIESQIPEDIQNG